MHRKMNKQNSDMITCTNKFSTHLMNSYSHSNRYRTTYTYKVCEFLGDILLFSQAV